jgi:hypothetical protein
VARQQTLFSRASPLATMAPWKMAVRLKSAAVAVAVALAGEPVIAKGRAARLIPTKLQGLCASP